MGSLCQDYSGIAVNQNAPSSGLFAWRDSGNGTLYQTFHFPTDYERGSNTGERRIPDLSGLSSLVSVDTNGAASASLNYRIDYQTPKGNWFTVVTGTAKGTQTDGLTWIDIFLPTSVPITETIAATLWRIGLTLPDDSSINAISYVNPSPIVGQVYAGDSITPLIADSSLNFRIFGLQADSGLDFLGNEYRSVVVNAPSGNVQTTLGTTPVTGAGQSRYWMSQVLPSPTAVEALYFDVRPVQSAQSFGVINFISDPSFEYDVEGTFASPWWIPFSTGATGTKTVTNNWSVQGQQSLLFDYTSVSGNPGTVGIESPAIRWAPITQGGPTPVTFSCVYNAIHGLNTSIRLVASFFDRGMNFLNSYVVANVSSPSGIGVLAGSQPTTPTSAVFVTFKVEILASGAFEIYVDALQATATAAIQPYFDGDTQGYEWADQAGDSVSMAVVGAVVQDNSTVIDSVLIDPLTPNMTVNVYYTIDDTGTSDQMTQDDWDNKLWSRVPQAYRCTGRQEYVFPDPIHAKYMKVEFTNPQAQLYNPGDFQVPVSYQQFPTWVDNYFKANNPTQPLSPAGIVNVQYDGLTIAMIPYLNDLVHTPAPPIAIPSDLQATTPELWSTGLKTLDSTTLGQIDLAIGQFQNPLGAGINQSTIGNISSTLLANQTNGPITIVEGDPNQLPAPNLTTVSSSNRDAVLSELIHPSMYFYLTCRHAYKQSEAVFDYNRGYVFGVSDIAFLRNNYRVQADTLLYVESNGDDTNTAFSDFVLGNDGAWYVY